MYADPVLPRFDLDWRQRPTNDKSRFGQSTFTLTGWHSCRNLVLPSTAESCDANCLAISVHRRLVHCNRCPHELRRVLLRRPYPRLYHHYPWESELEVTRKTIVTSVPERIHRSCCPCSCCGYTWKLFQSPATINPWVNHHISDPTYCKLHKWFTRFDRSGRGFLNLDELGCLLHHKGASLPVSQLRRLFDEADADNDGRLSFAEFVHMWHQAAAHEDDFLSATECRDLVDIVRTYDLHPRVFCHHCDFDHDIVEVDEIQRLTNQEMADDPSGCSCGSGSIIEPFVQPSVTTGSEEKEKHFVFSSNRSSLSPSDYKYQ
ncbi:Calmodulin-like protein 5 like protein [Argiope bruennichi]|uniref:Calmodulin-like protein 5 like protein n=1 Tax=Argiope bruennichi TaxID=94029 RepID=A0A8T0FPX1_ARGBR|nr:Calmodulin-like protein 5 like protein [Argiope bruennichi]